jgi:mannosyltransferase OCH1-like enzyme
MNFPKNIFQTWKNSVVPDNWKDAQQSVIEKNPNWKYTLLTDTDNDIIVKQHFLDFYRTFVSFKYPIQRADAIRYCVLYLYGGIYLDLDYVSLKSFDSLSLATEVGLIKSSNVDTFTNSFLCSQPKSYFWILCIQKMTTKLPFYLNIFKHTTIMNSTGPLMINNVATRNKKYITNLTNITVPCNICNLNNNTCSDLPGYYIMPIQGGSWNSVDSEIFNFILCNKLIFLALLFFYFTKLFVN